MPSAKPSGIALQVSQSGSRRIINLQGSSTLADNFKQLHLIGTIGQSTAFKTDVNLNETNFARRIIPVENLPSGILTITLFDAQWNALAERITFINNGEFSFRPQVEFQHWGLNKRARNEIQITIPDSLQGASLSVSVTDAAINKDTTQNIISHLLLTSDIRGYVHNPSYYFTSTGDSVAQYLDLVMLTNGWRRFKWEDLAKGKLPAITYPKDTAYLSLSGRVYGASKTQLSGKENMVLFVKEKDSASKMLLMPLNADGSFNDPEIIFFDTLKVFYQLKSKVFSNAEARFMTDRLPAFNYLKASKNFATLNPLFDTLGSYRNALLAAEALRLQNQAKGKLLESVTVRAKTKSPMQLMDEKYAKGMFTGDAYQFDLVNDPTATGALNIFNFLQGRVAGLQISTAGGTPSLSWRGATPQLYLDEMQIDADFLNTMSVTDIAYVKVFRPPFMGGSGGGSGGAIAIYTRKGDDQRSKPGSGLNSSTIAGYTPIRQFYAPNYGSFDKRNEQPDIRTTLYWNPAVLAGPSSRSVKITFYNNDVTKSFRVVIEGMSKEGLLTHYEEVME